MVYELPDRIEGEEHFILFHHHLKEKLTNAHMNDQAMELDGRTDDLVGIVNAYKIRFRDFLELVNSAVEKNVLILPKNYLPYSAERLKEAYQRSDFDWTDIAKLTSFYEWFYDTKIRKQ